jgi:hypothetical protein
VYILARKCKHNVFGKLTLPSGAEVPRSIRGRNLRQRFDKYHEQHPGQQAGKGYLETLARVRRPVPQDATCATPLAVAETSPGTEAVPPALPEVPRQPQCAAAPAQPRGILPTAGEQSAPPRPVAMSFARWIGEYTDLRRPSRYQRKHFQQRRSDRGPWMRESNFADIPKETTEKCVRFLAQSTTRQPKSNPERARARPPKLDEVPAPGIEDCAMHRALHLQLHKPWAQCNIPSWTCQKRTGDSPNFSGEEN